MLVMKLTWLWFTLIRLAVFVVPLVVMLWLGVIPWLAAVLAAVIGLCISYIFFARSRNKLSQDLYAARAAKKKVNVDEAVEDAAVEDALLEKDPGKA